MGYVLAFIIGGVAFIAGGYWLLGKLGEHWTNE